MTILYIDNKATATKSVEAYEVDRDLYQTEKDLMMLAGECMNEDVYLIRVLEDNKELFTMRNYR